MTISKRMFKLQTPIKSGGLNSVDPMVLVYDEAREFQSQIIGDFAAHLIDGLGMKPVGDRVYVEGLIDKQGQFIVNKDTLTREAQSW